MFLSVCIIYLYCLKKKEKIIRIIIKKTALLFFMPVPKIHYLPSSDKVFEHPAEFDLGVLEELLIEAHDAKLERKSLVATLLVRRERHFNPENPQYDTIKCPYTVSRLLDFYKEYFEKDFEYLGEGHLEAHMNEQIEQIKRQAEKSSFDGYAF
jgi:hypothetical protein